RVVRRSSLRRGDILRGTVTGPGEGCDLPRRAGAGARRVRRCREIPLKENGMVPAIDVHTHMLTHDWVKMLETHGKPHYTLQEVRGGLRAIHLDGAPFMTPVPAMFDWDLRVANMS